MAELGKKGQAIFEKVQKLLNDAQKEALRAKMRAQRPPRPAAESEKK